MTKTKTTQIIYCPNCGDRATRSFLDNAITRTCCESCDYLLVQCSKTGKVIESYAPGINSYCVIKRAPVSA